MINVLILIKNMDVGAQFDDEFFEKPKIKHENPPSNYEPKCCVPLWYMNAEFEGKDNADILAALKHQADFYYFSGNYQKAVEIYEKCLKLVPSSNSTWKREFMENISRSFLHLDDARQALEWAFKLLESSFSPDQNIVSMNLLALVCHKLGRYKEELEALHNCITIHKSCPEFWLRLGYCYAGMFKIELPNTTIIRPPEDNEPCCAFNAKKPSENSSNVPETEENLAPEECIATTSSTLLPTCSNLENPINTEKCEACSIGVQVIATCFIRAQVLIDTSERNRLGAERDAKIKANIQSYLKHLEIDQQFVDIASKMLGPDFLADVPDPSSIKENHSNDKMNEAI